MKLRVGDTVLVISGKDRGKTGKVTRVFAERRQVVVEGLNMRMKFVKRTPQQAGQRITFEAAMSAANVMLLDPTTKKPTRIGYRMDPKTGRKDRIARVSGAVIQGAAAVKTPKKTKDAKEEKDVKDSKNEKNVKETAATKKPAKKAFWQRMGFGADPTGTDAPHKTPEPDHPVAHQQHKPQSRGK